MPESSTASLDTRRLAGGGLELRLTGDWKLRRGLLSSRELERALRDGAPPTEITFDTSSLQSWDSGLVALLLKVQALCRERRVGLDPSGLPEGARRLLALATATPEAGDAGRSGGRDLLPARIGKEVLSAFASGGALLAFIGEVFLALARLSIGRARFRRADLWLFIQDSGAQALPIVTLISLLVGLILAFVGAVQLEKFGAQIYVANLVGVGMAREMAAMMTAIVMAGRTGAAYAAQLGTMQVNEEIDALRTLGIPATEFLVLPRMLALALMMPLLFFYANLLGMLGGAIVGAGLLDISWPAYVHQTQQAVTFTDFLCGLIKAAVFGCLVAVAGCMRGMQSGRSALAVGQATTAAVVTAIVYIIVADALLNVVYSIIGV